MFDRAPSSRTFAANRLVAGRSQAMFWHSQAANGLKSLFKASGKALTRVGLTSITAGGLTIIASASGSPRINAAVRSPVPREGLPEITVTHTLLALNVVMFGLQIASKELLTIWGVKVNTLIVAGQYWRLLTPAFLHGNLIHLIVNSVSLNNLGPTVERLSGGKRLAICYLVAAVAGNVASFFGSTAPSLGASGAVFGVGGALAMYFYQNKDIYGKQADQVLQQLWQTLLINLMYGLSNPRIDNWGHMGGLAGGALAAYLLGPKYKVATINGQSGKFLVDAPPIPLLASPPRQIRKW